MTIPSASSCSNIAWIFRARSSQSESTNAWLGRRRTQLLHAGNAFELRELRKQLTVAQSLIRLDVPSKIQAIGAHRIDCPACEDQSHSREQASHRKTLRVAVLTHP